MVFVVAHPGLGAVVVMTAGVGTLRVVAVQAVWFLKCRALTAKNWIDDTEMEEEGVAEMLLDDNAMASAPRCVRGLRWQARLRLSHGTFPSLLADVDNCHLDAAARSPVLCPPHLTAAAHLQ